MKQRIFAQICCGALMLSFFLGIHEGRLAMWKDEDPTPCRVFPCPVAFLPKPVQQILKTGIRLDTMDDVNRLLESFLS